MPFDELNALRQSLVYGQYTDDDGKRRYVDTYADLEDEFEDILIMSYILGSRAAGEMLGIEPPMDASTLDKVINKKISGKTWRERLREQLDNGGTVEDIMRIAETESHRDTNEAIYEVAKGSGIQNLYKTWETMEDDRVREAHEEIQGQTVPFEDVFVTWDGHEARFPGDFDTAELNVNCRCFLSVSLAQAT
jgi:hypothetical protein